MEKYLHYKGYTGSVNYTEEDGCFFGKVLGIKSLISYEGADLEEVEKDFIGAIDDYISLCEQFGETPEIPSETSNE